MSFFKKLGLISIYLAGVLFLPKPLLAITKISVPILMYHYIANNPNPRDLARYGLSITPDNFDAQMSYLKQQGFTPINLDTLYGIYQDRGATPKKPIVLSFDDGYTDFYLNAFPILKKYEFQSVSFIPTGLIGTSYYMSWDQVKQLNSTGLVEFEDHTISHHNLVQLSSNLQYNELLYSKKTLESHLGKPVNFVAYPYGVANQTVILNAQKAGFVGGLGTWYGVDTGPSMDMPRIKISGYNNFNQFVSALSHIKYF